MVCGLHYHNWGEGVFWSNFSLNPSDIPPKMCNIYGSNYFARSNVFELEKSLKSSTETVKNVSRPG